MSGEVPRQGANARGLTLNIYAYTYIYRYRGKYPDKELTQEDLPPISVIFSEGAEDVAIKISDKGGGIPRSGLCVCQRERQREMEGATDMKLSYITHTHTHTDGGGKGHEAALHSGAFALHLFRAPQKLNARCCRAV